MGDRYILTVKCPDCGTLHKDVWYAPTCDVTTFKCQCGHVVDLSEYTGISYEDASNAAELEVLIKKLAKSKSQERRLRTQLKGENHA